MAFELKELHCFIEILSDGGEEIIQTSQVDARTNAVHVIPMMTGSAKLAAKMKPMAQMHCNETHNKVKHVKLSMREDIETLEEILVKPAGPQAINAVDDFLKNAKTTKTH